MRQAGKQQQQLPLWLRPPLLQQQQWSHQLWR
jgi:hypothetical protein